MPLLDFLPSFLRCSPHLESLLVIGCRIGENIDQEDGTSTILLPNLRRLVIQALEKANGGSLVQCVHAPACARFRIEFRDLSDDLLHHAAIHLRATLEHLQSLHGSLHFVFLPNYQIVAGQFLIHYVMQGYPNNALGWELLEGILRCLPEDILVNLTRVSVSNNVWKEWRYIMIGVFHRHLLHLSTLEIERGQDSLNFSGLARFPDPSDERNFLVPCPSLERLAISGQSIVKRDMEVLLYTLKRRRETNPLSNTYITKLGLSSQRFPEEMLATFELQCVEQQLRVERMDPEDVFAQARTVAMEDDPYDLREEDHQEYPK